MPYKDKNNQLAAQKRYRLRNKEMILEKGRAYSSLYRVKNKEKLALNKTKRTHYDKKYRLNNKESIRESRKKYYHSNINVRLKDCLRARFNQALQGRSKSQSIIALVDKSVPELKLYLEAKFTEGMTWDNYGRTGWHIDHIRPCASFDLTDPEQQKECFHYTNLQPLWAKDNLLKHCKI